MKHTFGIESKTLLSLVILTACSLSLLPSPAFAEDAAATKTESTSGSPSKDAKAADTASNADSDKADSSLGSSSGKASSSDKNSSSDKPVKVQKEREKKSGTGEFLKYFNPVPEKTYLNKSQDRIIKKKAFKQVEVTGAKPIFNKETGFFAIVPYEKLGDTDYMSTLLDKPGVNGLSISAPWAVLEPVETEFDWKPIDKVLDLAKSKNKTVILRVTTAGLDNSRKSDTPEWVLASDVKTLKFKGSDKNEHVMPIFWDTNYLAKWNNFVAELADKYDENPQIHSIGITGGGILGSAGVVPDFSDSGTEKAQTGEGEKGTYKDLELTLTTEHKMTPRLLVEHWKYVSDMFPKYFTKARLNFDINPPIRGKKGQASLDEISDYLVYRYGQRIYLTRQGVKDGKHGFNEYRVLLKFHPDTLTGYQLRPDFDPAETEKLVKFAAEDGISYLEVPADLLTKEDPALQKAFSDLQLRMGYQFVSRQVNIPKDAKVGAPITASFDFVNLGSAEALKPSRQMDKDVAGSFKVQLELRNASSGKPTMRSLHTPEIPTNMWKSGEPIVWQEELKMPKLDPGKYDVYLSLVDVDTKRKLNFLNAIGQKEPELAVDAPVGSIEIK